MMILLTDFRIDPTELDQDQLEPCRIAIAEGELVSLSTKNMVGLALVLPPQSIVTLEGGRKTTTETLRIGDKILRLEWIKN